MIRLKTFFTILGEDEYGVFWEDIVINSKNPIATNVNFKTTIEDTSKPFVSSVNVLDNSHILIKFSEKINLVTHRFKIENTLDAFMLTANAGESLKCMIVFD